jgi:AcrR family transcriptional regulator
MPSPVRSPRVRLLSALDTLTEKRSALDVGIDAILARADVAKASLYDHFGSKDGLLVAWLDDRQARWFGFFDAHVAGRAKPGRPESALEAAFDFLAAWFARPDFSGCPFVATFLQVKDPGHPAAVVARAYAARLRAFFRGRLVAMRAPGPDSGADALLELFLGAVVAHQMGVARSPAAAARHAARRIWRAPRGSAPGRPASARRTGRPAPRGAASPARQRSG